MTLEGDYYKRKEDQEWRERVDFEQITLKTGHQVLSDRQDEIDNKLDDIENLLRGDPVKDTSGLIEQIHELRTEVSRLNSVIFMDSTGKHGLAHDIDVLMGRKQANEKDKELHWKAWTAIAVALVTLLGAVLANLEKIMKLLKKQDPVEQMIEKAKHPKPRHRHYVIKQEAQGDQEPQASTGQ